VVLRVSERVAEAESKTDEALADLRQSFAALDGRLRTLETPNGPPIEQRLEALAADLAQRVEAARSEMAAGLAAASEGRFDRMERTLGEMSEHVRAAEQRSAEAIEQMGAEVRSVADTLNRRVEASEHRSAEAIEQVGGEMARIGQAMEQRLARTDVVHAEALEKLGGEIARITERLAERMSSAERRSAQALDDMNEQVSRSTERMQQRQERASDDLAERIRLSEERTAKLLEEARETIDKRLAETQARVVEPIPVASPQAFGAFGGASFSPAAGLPAAEAFARLGPAEPNPFADAAPERAPAPSSAFAQAFPAAAFPAEAERPAFAAEDFEAADGFTRAPDEAADPADDGFRASDTFEPAPGLEAAVEAEPEPVAAETSAPEEDDHRRAILAAAAFSAPPKITAFEPPPMAEPIAPMAETYDDAPTADDFAAELKGAEAEIEAEPEAIAAEPEPEAEPAEAELAAPEAVESLAAADDPFATTLVPDEPEAKSADVDAELAAAWAPPQDDEDESQAGRPLTTREVIEQARAAARASQQNSDSKAKRARAKAEKDEKGGGLFSSFGLRPRRRAGTTLNTALLVTFAAAGLTIASAGIFLSQGKPGGETPDRIAESKARDAATGAIAAGEADTTPRAAIALTPQPMGPTGAAPDSALDAAALYEGALSAIAIDDPGGLDDLKTAANLGYAPAQFYLGKLFQEGKHGVKKDLVEARRWTERAALAGDRTAMHNFALNNYFGEGGPKDVKAAADWFRRAAELGLVDSQYNLGRLYEDGQGVTKNAAEAYKWYLIAARAGDVGAQGSLVRVRNVLSPEAKTVAERAAAGFTPALPTRAPTAVAQVDGSTQAVATAQKVLSRLSYYSGPADGVSSPALRGAIAAYQRDRGLPPTGSLDQATVTQLSVYTR
jgi:localization factor PodJL